MSLRSPAENEKWNPTTQLTLQKLTPIQTSPVEGEGSAPPLDGEDTGGVLRTATPRFSKEVYFCFNSSSNEKS